MVLVRCAELWDSPADQPYMIVVTTTAVANRYGKQVMGAGTAAQARALYEELPEMCFKKNREFHPEFHLDGHNENYGVLRIISPPNGVMIFQTKYHLQFVARLDTI